MSAHKSIIIVTLHHSIVIKGIQKQLEKMEYYVEVLEMSYGYKDVLDKNADLYILYLPGEITVDEIKHESIDQFVDAAKDEEKRLIVIGEKKYRDDVIEGIPSAGAYTWVDRPVEPESFSDVVERVLFREPLALLRKHILIVDDDPAYAKMAREWLLDDFRVDLVTSGTQALQFLTKQPKYEQVDLVLLDYEMPVVDGPKVFAMLRTDPATKHIPVVFLTGVGGREEVRRVMELKPEGYLLKSATREDIITYIKEKI